MATGDPPVTAGSEQVSDAPTATTSGGAAIQSTPTSVPGESIPLAPLPPVPPSVPEALRQRVRFLDGLLVLLVLVFAFACASFRTSNTDYFLHLATGRHILSGSFPFADPFTFAAQGTWINHAWLFDVALYALESIGGPSGILIVVVKALLVVATAELLLRASCRPGQRLWVPVLCTLLAILVISPRLLLQPTVVSMALFAGVICVLHRAATRPGLLWLLPLLCLVWVNVDSWFVLGPITIFLTFLGEVVDRALGRSSSGETPARLGIVCAVSVAACLVNPYHVQAFTVLPAGMLRGGGLLPFEQEPSFRAFFISPFQAVYFSPYLGLSAAGLSYFVLLALSLFSFVLVAVRGREQLRISRLFVWLFAAGITAWNYRAIPFFAIAAGPITALNFLDLYERLAGSELPTARGMQRWATGGRVLTVLAGLALILVSIPGRLQAQPHVRRQLGWGVDVDAGLRDTCLALAKFQSEGAISDGTHVFNVTPEAMNYLAWFAPTLRGWTDHRMDLFTGSIKDYVTVRKALAGEGQVEEGGEGPAPAPWRRIFTDRDVRFVLFHSSDLSRSSTSLTLLARLYASSEEFVPSFAEGSAALFAWRDPRPGRSRPLDSRLSLDYSRSAFGGDTLRAPETPPRASGTSPWWHKLLEIEKPPTPESLTALQQTTRFDAMGSTFERNGANAWVGANAASFLGLSNSPTGALLSGVMLPIRLSLVGTFMRNQDAGPPASLYLGVRASRRGLEESPDDVIAQYFLAEAYGRLAYRTRERSRITAVANNRVVVVFPQVQAIRQAQIAAALQSVLSVEPRPEHARAAHQLLAQTFSEPAYFELQVKHLDEFLKLSMRIGPSGSMNPNTYREQLKALDENLKKLKADLKNRKDQFVVNSASKPVLHKALTAYNLGLAETALNLLLRADPKDLRDPNDPREVPGGRLAIHLLLGLGRVREAREALAPPEGSADFDKRVYGFNEYQLPAYEWFQAVLGASTGDYEGADQALAECLEARLKAREYSFTLAELDLAPMSAVEKESNKLELSARMVGNILLRESRYAQRMSWNVQRIMPFWLHEPHIRPGPRGDVRLNDPRPISTLVRGSSILQGMLEGEADLWTLRAWLALESGRIDNANVFADKALSLAEMGKDTDGESYYVAFRSRGLTLLIKELIAAGKN